MLPIVPMPSSVGYRPVHLAVIGVHVDAPSVIVSLTCVSVAVPLARRIATLAHGIFWIQAWIGVAVGVDGRSLIAYVLVPVKDWLPL